MPTYKVVNSEQLDADLKVVADAIRSKSGTTASLEFPNEMKSAIESIEADEIPTQEKTVEITENGTTEIEADEGYLLSKATVNVNVASSGGGENKLAKLVDRSITEITAADLQGVTSIGNFAFANCKEMTSITIPNSATHIGHSAFKECGITKIVIPESIETMDSFVFTDASKLDSVEFAQNSKLKKINESTFRNCSKLTSITIPNSVTQIEYNLFYGCTQLKNVTIGSGVTVIRYSAFSGCSALERVKVFATKPPFLQSALQGIPTNCVFEVPAAAYETYDSATNWSALNLVASEEF